MYRILVVPSGTEIGFEIIRSLKDVKYVSLFGANSIESYSDLPKSNLISGIPYIDDDEFINSIEKIVDDFSITHIFPAHDSAAIKLSLSSEKLHAKVVSSSYETNEICRSKIKTYNLLSDFIKVPKIFEKNSKDLIFPLFAKPDVGQGSVGAKKIENIEEVKSLSNDDVLCEFLPGNEYTVDCVTDSNGKLIYSKARLRSVIRNGIAVGTKLVEDDFSFNKIADKINEIISFKGAWFFQVKKDSNDKLCLLEVSTRVAGSMITSRFNGVNFSELSLLISECIPVSVINNNLKVKLYRNLSYQFDSDLKYKTIYVDFDDCLVINGKVNEKLVAFMFNAINENKKVVLITRHSEDINKSLEKIRLSGFFDEIIHIKNNDKKSFFIKDKDSIFIDDSYSERKDVHDEVGIPCFSVDMIPGLLSLKKDI